MTNSRPPHIPLFIDRVAKPSLNTPPCLLISKPICFKVTEKVSDMLYCTLKSIVVAADCTTTLPAPCVPRKRTSIPANTLTTSPCSTFCLMDGKAKVQSSLVAFTVAGTTCTAVPFTTTTKLAVTSRASWHSTLKTRGEEIRITPECNAV